MVAVLSVALKARGVCVSMEQPSNSVLQHHPSFVSLRQMATLRTVVTWMGAFGLCIPKCAHIYTTAPLKHAVFFFCGAPSQRHWIPRRGGPCGR
eukprot:8580530-Pyramimonas_sp.AAC.1